MESVLRKLFEFQKFEENPRLSEMLADAENRYESISDDDLEMVSAAGECTTETMNPLEWMEPDDD